MFPLLFIAYNKSSVFAICGVLLFHALFYSFHERRNVMDTKRIGKFISENRKRKGLTQEQLGELLGVTNKTISRWENGNYMPDLSLLVPLSETLDISLMLNRKLYP